MIIVKKEKKNHKWIASVLTTIQLYMQVHLTDNSLGSSAVNRQQVQMLPLRELQFLASRYIMCLNQTSKFKVMTF